MESENPKPIILDDLETSEDRLLIEKRKAHMDKAFIYCMILLGLLALIITLSLLYNGTKARSSAWIGLCAVLIIAVAPIGTFHSIKGIKAPNSFKKISSLIINLTMLGLSIMLIVSLIFDMSQL